MSSSAIPSWLGAGDSPIGLGLAGLGGAAGAFPTNTTTNGNSSTTSSGTSSFSQNLQTLLNSLSTISGQTSQQGGQSGTSTGLTTGGYADAGSRQLSDQLATAFSGLTKAPDLTGYQAQQTEGINRNSQLLGQNQQQELAARGLSTSPVAASVAAGTQAGRVGQITNLQQSIPLLSNQLALANLGAGNSFLANAPKTSSTVGSNTGTNFQTGTSQQVGTTSQTGSQVGAGSTQQNQNSSTTQQQQQKQGGGFGQFLGGLGGVLASLFL